MAVIIVSATLKDKEAIAEYIKHYGSREIIEKRADCYITHNHTILAKDGDKIAGMLQWQIKEDPRAGVVELEEVYILEKYRNKGVGSRMIDFAIKEIRTQFKKMKIKPRKIFLFVSKNNDAARALYEKYGFKSIAELGCLLSEKNIDLLYTLDL